MNASFMAFSLTTESTSICFTSPKSYAFTGLREYIKIIKIGVRGGIAKGAKGIEICNRLLADVRLHILRFINNYNRVCALDKLNGHFSSKLVIGLVDDVFVFAKESMFMTSI